jgi:hypothetical protein
MRPAYLIILIVLNFFWAASLSAYKVIEPHLQPGGGHYGLRLASVRLLLLWLWLSGKRSEDSISPKHALWGWSSSCSDIIPSAGE